MMIVSLPTVVGVLRGQNAKTALVAAQTALEAGLQAIEITLTTPEALTIIRSLAANSGDLIGAGTVLTVAQANQAIEAGAKFLVSPHFTKAVLEIARAKNILYIPGVITPNEIASALEFECPILKLFPITRAGGMAYLKDLLGPYPNLQVMVSGGIKSAEVNGYLQAGAAVVGLGDFLTGNDVAAQTRALLEQLSEAA